MNLKKKTNRDMIFKTFRYLEVFSHIFTIIRFSSLKIFFLFDVREEYELINIFIISRDLITFESFDNILSPSAHISYQLVFLILSFYNFTNTVSCVNVSSTFAF